MSNEIVWKKENTDEEINERINDFLKSNDSKIGLKLFTAREEKVEFDGDSETRSITGKNKSFFILSEEMLQNLVGPVSDKVILCSEYAKILLSSTEKLKKEIKKKNKILSSVKSTLYRLCKNETDPELVNDVLCLLVFFINEQKEPEYSKQKESE